MMPLCCAPLRPLELAAVVEWSHAIHQGRTHCPVVDRPGRRLVHLDPPRPPAAKPHQGGLVPQVCTCEAGAVEPRQEATPGSSRQRGAGDGRHSSGAECEPCQVGLPSALHDLHHAARRAQMHSRRAQQVHAGVRRSILGQHGRGPGGVREGPCDFRGYFVFRGPQRFREGHPRRLDGQTAEAGAAWSGLLRAEHPLLPGPVTLECGDIPDPEPEQAPVHGDLHGHPPREAAGKAAGSFPGLAHGRHGADTALRDPAERCCWWRARPPRRPLHLCGRLA
mmetsp:Transcript_73745/g.232910  ORF Transcript_73745/g.232910 Transcript_73745/m.232910 type:complete len:279 (+) Transcript_73745:3-839(+)